VKSSKKDLQRKLNKFKTAFVEKHGQFTSLKTGGNHRRAREVAVWR